ncbi:NADPH-dependent FMN reductase [Neobacillus sp. SCS-31]|uniref:NADPH-dependent FMN reductase n=1 Tax=Neobacillus oceani TaxID=3115292 RepID=UPI003906A90D
MKILGISGTILGAKTAVLVKAVLDEIKDVNPDAETTLLDLREYEMQFCDGRKPELYNDDTRKVIQSVTEADLYLIGFPIFNGSIPGPLKNLFDLVPPDVFRNKVMGFVANGGTYQHYLVIENQVKPIAGYFRSYVAPSYVYTNAEHFNRENQITDIEVLNRIKMLAGELVMMQEGFKVKKPGIV